MQFYCHCRRLTHFSSKQIVQGMQWVMNICRKPVNLAHTVVGWCIPNEPSGRVFVLFLQCVLSLKEPIFKSAQGQRKGNSLQRSLYSVKTWEDPSTKQSQHQEQTDKMILRDCGDKDIAHGRQQNNQKQHEVGSGKQRASWQWKRWKR